MASALRTHEPICLGLFTLQEIKRAILRFLEKLQKRFNGSLKNFKIFIMKRGIQHLAGGGQEDGKGKGKQIRRGTRPNCIPSTHSGKCRPVPAAR